MKQPFVRRSLRFLLLIALVAFALYGIHSYVAAHFLTDKVFVLPLWGIYFFHFVTVAIVFALVNYTAVYTEKPVFPVFMYATLGKMVLAIVFLLPVLFKGAPHPQVDVLNFFIPYFIFLAVEVAGITKLLK